MKLISSPWSLIPCVLGLTDLLLLWGFDIRSGPAAFAGIASILAGVGIFLTRLLLGNERAFQKVLEELDRKTRMQQEKALDQLDSELVKDRDSRTQSLLRDLRALHKAFQEDRTWSQNLNPQSIFDIVSKVEKLFSHCVLSLKQTLTLWSTARKMSTPLAKEPILEQREHLVQDVADSIHQLGILLARLQRMRFSEDHDNTELARIRKELETSLAVAEAVEKRVAELDREIQYDRIE